MGVTTLAIAGLVGSVASAGMGMLAASNQAKAAAGAANYNAAVARNAAQYATESGNVEAQAAQRRTAALIGRQRAAYAAGSINVNSGSPLDVQADTAEIGKLDVLTIRNNAARQAWGYKAQENLDTAAAANAKTAGTYNEVGALIGGVSSVSDKWLNYKQAGVLGGGGGSSTIMPGGSGEDVFF